MRCLHITDYLLICWITGQSGMSINMKSVCGFLPVGTQDNLRHILRRMANTIFLTNHGRVATKVKMTWRLVPCFCRERFGPQSNLACCVTLIALEFLWVWMDSSCCNCRASAGQVCLSVWQLDSVGGVIPYLNVDRIAKIFPKDWKQYVCVCVCVEHKCKPWAGIARLQYKNKSTSNPISYLSSSHTSAKPCRLFPISFGELPPAEQCAVLRGNHGRNCVRDSWGQHHRDRLWWRQPDCQWHQDGVEEGHRHHQWRHPPHRPGARPKLR